jgi:glucose-6-phosphate-specific signal transduction histidine kinase
MQGASPCCILYCASDALLNGVGRHIVESSFFFFFLPVQRRFMLCWRWAAWNDWISYCGTPMLPCMAGAKLSLLTRVDGQLRRCLVQMPPILLAENFWKQTLCPAPPHVSSLRSTRGATA